MHKPFKVFVTTTVTSEYTIDANTPEEAEAIAEDLLADGCEPESEDMNIEGFDTYPIDGGEEME